MIKLFCNPVEDEDPVITSIEDVPDSVFEEFANGKGDDE